MKKFILLFSFIVFLTEEFRSQEDYVSPSTAEVKLPTQRQCKKFSRQAARKCNRLSERLRKSTDYYLLKLDQTEEALIHQVCRVDERHAESLLRNSLYSFRRFEGRVKREAGDPVSNAHPEMNHLNTVLEYMEDSLRVAHTEDEKNCGCPGKEDLRKAQQNLRNEMKRTEIAGSYIRERTAYLKNLENEYPHLGGPVMAGIEKVRYYSAAQTKEYMSLFADRSGAEKTFFSLLEQVPGFSEFAQWKQGAAGISGAASPAPASPPVDVVWQQFQQAVADQGMDIGRITNPDFLKNKWEEKTSGLKKDLPDNRSIPADSSGTDSLKNNGTKQRETWKVNPLKTKRFVDRLRYGFTVQTSPRNTFFPTSAMLNAQVGYEITTKSNVGIGASHITGWSSANGRNDLNALRVTSGGLGLRSFADWNFTRRFFLQAGYEVNLRQSVTQQGWTGFSPRNRGRENLYESACVGLKWKTPSARKSQKTVEVLYDAFHSRTGQPAIVIRTGMEFLPKHAYKH